MVDDKLDQKIDKKQLITGTTKLLGIIGNPVEHSLSPVMQNAAISELGLDYVYLPFPVEPENLEKSIMGLATIGVVGFNATIPHKQALLPLLGKIEPLALSVGAINTVIWRNNQWVGTNTDVEGFISPLQKYDFNLRDNADEGLPTVGANASSSLPYPGNPWGDRTAVILGNGGAARAVVAGCHQLGIRKIHVVGRNLQKLEEFRQSWLDSPLNINVKVSSWDNLAKFIPQTNLLVNTTPLGMYPKVNDSPLSEEEISLIPKDLIAYDLIYTPKPTLFLKQAQQKGAIIIDGLEMLIQQGAAALKMWLQRETVPVDVMKSALRKRLKI
ncbi:MAG: shikimate dehydrogenase [Cyanobacteria bacterium P01_A01_bin.84]